MSSSSSSSPSSPPLEKLKLLSWYAPVIVRAMVVALTAFASAPLKGVFYFLWFFAASAIRVLFSAGQPLADKCTSSGFIIPNKPGKDDGATHDYTYSVFSIAYALAYFMFPMMMVTVETGSDVMNYSVLGLLVAYLGFDVFIKRSCECAGWMQIAKDAMLAIALGIGASGGLMYATSLKKYLFVSDIGSKSTCAVATDQKFKCHMYRNGQLIA